MEREKNIIENKARIFLILIFIVGIIGHLLNSLRPLMISITPYTLIITGAVVLYLPYRNKNFSLLIWCFITYIITLIIEIIGVKTGLIFGSYNYGSSLGFKVFGVPLVIGFNWVLVVLGSINIARLSGSSLIRRSILAGTLAVIFDLFLEQVAIKLDYWTWVNNLVPLQNYYAWFFITFIASISTGYFKVKVKTAVVRDYFMIQLVFFITLYFFL